MQKQSPAIIASQILTGKVAGVEFVLRSKLGNRYSNRSDLCRVRRRRARSDMQTRRGSRFRKGLSGESHLRRAGGARAGR